MLFKTPSHTGRFLRPLFSKALLALSLYARQRTKRSRVCLYVRVLPITTVCTQSMFQADVLKNYANPKGEIMPSQQHEIGQAPSNRPPWRLDNARWAFLVSHDRSQSPPQLGWSWRALGKNGVTWEGDDRFGSLEECQSDAATHGFDGVRE